MYPSYYGGPYKTILSSYAGCGLNTLLNWDRLAEMMQGKDKTEMSKESKRTHQRK